MATNRSDLRTRARTYLSDWYIDTDTINEGAAFASSDTTLTVSDGTKFKKGWFIEIESEVLKVTAVSSNDLTVTRGQMGTAAVEHADGTAVNIIDGWTDAELNRYIDDSFRALYPNMTQDYETKTNGYNQFLIIDNCEAASNWTEADDAITPTDNTSDQELGKGCVNLGLAASTGYGSYSQTLAATVNMDNYDYLNFLFYIETKKDSSDDYTLDRDKAIEVKVGNDSSNYKSAFVSLDELEQGWNYITIGIQDFTETTGTVTTSTIDYFELKLYEDDDNAISVAIGDFKMDQWSFSTFPMVQTGEQRYRLPEGVFGVHEIWICTDKECRQYSKMTDWEVKNDYLFIYHTVEVTNGKPIKIFARKKLAILSDDTTNMELQDEGVELVGLYAAIKATERQMTKRMRFDKYSARVNQQDSSIGSLVQLKTDLMARYEDLRRKHANFGHAIERE